MLTWKLFNIYMCVIVIYVDITIQPQHDFRKNDIDELSGWLCYNDVSYQLLLYLKWQRMKFGFQKRKRITRAYNQVAKFVILLCLNLDSLPKIADEMSIREPLFCDDDDDDIHSCSDSSSFNNDSEPENSSSVCWRAERLSREEFIAVCTNIV